jgi:UDP-N-acetylglucosamine 4,6-dehydratase
MKINAFEGRTLLITGGTGSFGNAVLDRFLETTIKEIRIFSRDEKKQDDMRRVYQNEKLRFYIGDVRDLSSIDNAMRGVDYVFSAAALKQVPSCEFYPLEAVRTNIVGTDNTLEAAARNGVSNVVVLSTDKAVYPVNAMGMSKALMEKTAIAKARAMAGSLPVICVTRYGNVMASRGSVIPLFIEQLKAGLPITVTDPDMTRFMMSLTDSVDLVIFAYENGRAGDLLVQKAPAATIGQLARVLMDIFGKRSEIKYIGTRHGEKKHETLANREELVRAEDMGRYFRIQSDMRDLNYDLFFNSGKESVNIQSDYTSENTHQLSDEELRDMLLSLDYVLTELKSDR